ncbi:MAG TPA: hypothetical protein PKI61_02035 [bacterium]|nr:hypothetical protein [bacterium]HPT29644.1 hypothetical protein [bacterium]
MKNGNQLNRSIDLNEFKDREGISLGRLNFGLWIVSHRRTFIIILIVVLLALSAVFYGYSIYSYVDYFFFGGKKERAAIEQLATDQAIADIQKLRNNSTPLQLGGVQTFSHDGKYDFLTQIVNPNKDFYSDFQYCIYSGEEELACQSGFILPSETKYFSILNQELKGYPGSVALKLKEQGWQRIDAHDYPNWPEFVKNHLNFSITNATFKSAKQTTISEKLDLDTVEFTIANNTSYGYFDVPLNIVVFSGNLPVGVNLYGLNNFASGESRNIKIVWPNSLPTVSRVEVYPSLNILQSDIYIRY